MRKSVTHAAASRPAIDEPLMRAKRSADERGTSAAGASPSGWSWRYSGTSPSCASDSTSYRHPVEERDIEEMRLAFSVLTTYWDRKGGGRRLHVTDLGAFHRAFGAHRFERRARTADC